MVGDGSTRPSEASAPGTLAAERYVLGSVIGRGASAEVYRARDRVLGRVVAIKLFPATEAGPAQRRWWREARTLAGLNHPGLVAVYDVGQQDGRGFFVMQLVDGPTLATRLRGGGPTLTVADTLRLGETVAAGLAHVHRHGVIHRDIKPGNILLDAAGRPYLSDFGIATAPSATANTGEDFIVGTASYLAPEQVRGQPVGPPADTYALGLVLLECLTGRCEYPGEPVQAAAERLHRPPRIPDQLPPAVATVLVAMTAPEPADRPDAAQIAAHLHTLLTPAAAHEPTRAPAPQTLLPGAAPDTAASGRVATVGLAARQPATPGVRAGARAGPGPAGHELAPTPDPPFWRRRHASVLAAAVLVLILVAGTVIGLGDTRGAATSPAARVDPSPLVGPGPLAAPSPARPARPPNARRSPRSRRRARTGPSAPTTRPSKPPCPRPSRRRPRTTNPPQPSTTTSTPHDPSRSTSTKRGSTAPEPSARGSLPGSRRRAGPGRPPPPATPPPATPLPATHRPAPRRRRTRRREAPQPGL